MRNPLVRLVTVGLVLGLTVPSTAAHAADPDRLSNEIAVSGTPHVLDGSVQSIARVGATMLLGGEFRAARNDTSKVRLRRHNLLAFDAASGRIRTRFRPNPNGPVRKVLDAGDGRTVYVAGDFTSIGGVRRRNLARVRISDGSVVRRFNAGQVAGQVRDLALVGRRLWVGGAFTHIGGGAQRALATVDPRTGDRTHYMGIRISGTHRGGVTQVVKFDVAGDRLIAIGNFRRVAGKRRDQLLVLGLAGSAATLSGFRTDFYSAKCSAANDTYLRDVDVSPDGSWFVVVTTGGYHGAAKSCDTAARFETRPSGTARVKPSWVNATGGDTTLSVEVTPVAVYVGGHFRWQNNPLGGDRAGQGAVPRSGIAALDPVNGLPLTWDPGRTLGVGVYDFLATPEGLWVASDTDRINWQLRSRIARMRPDGVVVQPVRTPDAPADLYAAGASGLTRQEFTGDSIGVPEPSAVGPAWSNLRAAFMVNGELFSVGAEAQLQRSSFDGLALGSARPVATADRVVPVAGWRTDLRRVTGMFLDRGRLFYTLRGDPTLYYRYFSPQSGVVGATRLAADRATGAVDYSRMRGMFLAGSRLHWIDSLGHERSAAWRRSAQAGRTDHGGVTVGAVAGPAKVRFLFQAAPPGPAIAPPATVVREVRDLQYVAARTVSASGRKPRIRLPRAIRAGDRLLLQATVAGGKARPPRTPSGWSVVRTVRSGGEQARLWTRRATARDAGSRVSVRLASRARTRLTMVVHRSADGPVSVLASATRVRGPGLVRPARVRARYGTWVVQFLSADAGRRVGWHDPQPWQVGVQRATAARGPAVLVRDTAAPVAPGGWTGAPVSVTGNSRRVLSISVALGVR